MILTISWRLSPILSVVFAAITSIESMAGSYLVEEEVVLATEESAEDEEAGVVVAVVSGVDSDDSLEGFTVWHDIKAVLLVRAIKLIKASNFFIYFILLKI